MTFSIPKQLKDLNTLTFDLILPVELNDTDVDRMLSQIMERAIKQGRTAPSKTDPLAYDLHLAELQASPDLSGFTDERGREVLDGWLRTSVIAMSTVGLTRVGEQMDYVRPITIAAFRSGLPKAKSRHRKADALVYRAITHEIGRRGGKQLETEAAKLFREALGHGVDVGVNPWAEPRYDETTTVDINELLALRFLETFPGNKNPGRDAQSGKPDDAIPGAVHPIGRDLVFLLEGFRSEWAPSEIVTALAGLTSVRLFQLPLRIATACRSLLEGSDAPDVDSADAANPLAIYCDFTRRRGGPSDELSRRCVARDLELLRAFFADRLMLRSIAQAAVVTADHNHVGDLPPAEQLRNLAQIRTDPQIEMALRIQLRTIEAALDDSPAGDEGRDLLREVRAAGLPAAEELTAVLVEGLRKRGLENQVKWFWSTGGLIARGDNRPYAILDGLQGTRSTWRYAPAEGLLGVLLSMCFIEESGRVSSSLEIAELLRRLESRYGLLVSRPPADMDSADARAGAAENLQAFTGQLKLLGCFRGLSDDFNAQYVTRPREAKA